MQIQLRRYQQEGLNWLAFLRRFGLHGVLADDMGLGKTLQATTIIAASALERQSSSAVPAGSSPAAAGGGVLPSLVVCPSTLVGHWESEMPRYIEGAVLRPLAIAGSPAERAAAARLLATGTHNVGIISYDALRGSADWAAGIEWDYVILDEGHVIRNTKSRIAQARRQAT
jgi:TATA-binding protein-associated factor